MHFAYFLLPLPVFCRHAHKRPIYSSHFANTTAVPPSSFIASPSSDVPSYPSLSSELSPFMTEPAKNVIRAEPTSSVTRSPDLPSRSPVTVDFQIVTITIGDESSSQAPSNGTSSTFSASSMSSPASVSTTGSAATSTATSTSKSTSSTPTTMSKVTSKSTQGSTSSTMSKLASKSSAKPKSTPKPTPKPKKKGPKV
ncbi:hypothetical protein GGS26DRAFT_601642 [Hypomontagnella submonticulosa]|nr:hypothetical protein GGS26DRAFT_601642 [Hypomontagnella submonticulosa]